MDNWRDVYEERTTGGLLVVDVWMRDGKAVAYETTGFGVTGVNSQIANLVKKQKPKKYRPFTRSEIKCGDVFRHKSNGVDYMIAIVGDCYVKFANDGGAIDTAVILEKYTKPDGSPAGMLED